VSHSRVQKQLNKIFAWLGKRHIVQPTGYCVSIFWFCCEWIEGQAHRSRLVNNGAILIHTDGKKGNRGLSIEKTCVDYERESEWITVGLQPRKLIGEWWQRSIPIQHYRFGKYHFSKFDFVEFHFFLSWRAALLKSSTKPDRF